MNVESLDQDRTWRAAVHRALGEDVRLGIVDALRLGDRTPSDLAGRLAMPSNLLAHHLDVLEDAGVIQRRTSQGDARRRYVTLVLDDPLAPVGRALGVGRVLFVCTRNAARSQLAAALWRQVTRQEAASAGSEPASGVDPLAVEVAAMHGLDLGTPQPRGYQDVGSQFDLVVSVCDRAFEQGVPFDAHHLHWSVADPAGGDRTAYADAFDHIRRRIHRLAAAA